MRKPPKHTTIWVDLDNFEFSIPKPYRDPHYRKFVHISVLEAAEREARARGLEQAADDLDTMDYADAQTAILDLMKAANDVRNGSV